MINKLKYLKDKRVSCWQLAFVGTSLCFSCWEKRKRVWFSPEIWKVEKPLRLLLSKFFSFILFLSSFLLSFFFFFWDSHASPFSLDTMVANNVQYFLRYLYLELTCTYSLDIFWSDIGCQGHSAWTSFRINWQDCCHIGDTGWNPGGAVSPPCIHSHWIITWWDHIYPVCGLCWLFSFLFLAPSKRVH